MPFGTGQVVTNIGRAIVIDRLQTTPGTYTAAPKYVAMGTGATGAARTAAVGDTALTTQVETRTSGTESPVTTSVTGDTYQVQGSIQATAQRNVDEAGLFTASSGGSMFVSATFTAIPLEIGDSILFTIKAQAT